MLSFFTLPHVDYAHRMVIWKPNLIALSGIYHQDHELLLLSLPNCSSNGVSCKHTGPRTSKVMV